MLKKSVLLENLKSLPEKVSAEEVIERVILLEKIEEGMQDSAENKTFSIKEAKKRMSQWLE